MTTIHGIYHGDHIDLKERLDLPLGAEVRLSVEEETLPIEERRKRLLDSFGSITDPTFFEAMDEIERQRHERMPRPPVDFDEAS